MGKFNEELVKAGVCSQEKDCRRARRAARALQRQQSALLSMGFCRNQELIAGFWMLQVKSKEEAIEWIQALPQSARGRVRNRDRQGVRGEDFGAEFTPELRAQEERLREQVAKAGKSRAWGKIGRIYPVLIFPPPRSPIDWENGQSFGWKICRAAVDQLQLTTTLAATGLFATFSEAPVVNASTRRAPRLTCSRSYRQSGPELPTGRPERVDVGTLLDPLDRPVPMPWPHPLRCAADRIFGAVATCRRAAICATHRARTRPRCRRWWQDRRVADAVAHPQQRRISLPAP